MIVSIADREGDIYNIYEEAQNSFFQEGAKAHYLIRAKTDRKVCTEEGKATESTIPSKQFKQIQKDILMFIILFMIMLEKKNKVLLLNLEVLNIQFLNLLEVGLMLKV